MNEQKDLLTDDLLNVLDSIQIYGGYASVHSDSHNVNCTYLKVCTSE